MTPTSSSIHSVINHCPDRNGLACAMSGDSRLVFVAVSLTPVSTSFFEIDSRKGQSISVSVSAFIISIVIEVISICLIILG